MAQGMNMGIFSLMAVIISVLVGIAGFFRLPGQKSRSGNSSRRGDTNGPNHTSRSRK